MSKLKVPRAEWDLVSDRAFIVELGAIRVFMRRDIPISPDQFTWLLSRDEPGETIQPNKGRFVVKNLDSNIGPLVSKRFHYHRTYRKKQRFFMGYCWQHAHGPTQFTRALYANLMGHRVVEPVSAMQRNVSGWRQESLLITRHARGVALKDFFLDRSINLDNKIEKFKIGLCELRAMHADGVAFGDAQTRHQIFDEEAGCLWWLDFDKMAVRNIGVGKRDCDLRRFFSSSLLRITQSGHSFEDTYGSMLEVLDAVYPQPALWRRIFSIEVRRRIKRMHKRPGYQKL